MRPSMRAPPPIQSAPGFSTAWRGAYTPIWPSHHPSVTADICSTLRNGLRKVEAALQGHFGQRAVVTVGGDHLGNFLDEETEVVGVATMNPLGLNPLTQIGQYFGGSEAFAVREFHALVRGLREVRERRRLRFRIVVGGTGALEFVNLSPDVRAEIMERLGIDHVVYGEVDASAALLFREIGEGRASEVVLMTEFNRRHGLLAFGRVEDLPLIVRPSMYDIIEVMRGCGHNCTFCEPNLRAARNMPFPGFIEREVSVNLHAGGSKRNPSPQKNGPKSSSREL